MGLTTKRKEQVIDMDLDISNLFKENEIQIDTSAMYLRLTGDIDDDSSALIMNGTHMQMVNAMFASLVMDENFKACALDAVSNFLARKDNSDELLFFLETIDEIKDEHESLKS